MTTNVSIQTTAREAVRRVLQHLLRRDQAHLPLNAQLARLSPHMTSLLLAGISVLLLLPWLDPFQMHALALLALTLGVSVGASLLTRLSVVLGWAIGLLNRGLAGHEIDLAMLLLVLLVVGLRTHTYNNLKAQQRRLLGQLEEREAELQRLRQQIHNQQAQIEALTRERQAILIAVKNSIQSPLANMHEALAGIERFTPIDAPGSTLVQIARHIRSELAGLTRKLVRGLELAENPPAPCYRPIDLTRLLHSALPKDSDPLRRPALLVHDRRSESRPLHGDERMLRMMLGMIIENSWRYGARRIDIILETPRHYHNQSLIIEIIDDGEGIAEDELPLVGQRLFRGRNALHRRDRPGLGLGINIARGIAAAHQGMFHIESRLGSGTTVTIALPLHPAQ